MKTAMIAVLVLLCALKSYGDLTSVGSGAVHYNPLLVAQTNVTVFVAYTNDVSPVGHMTTQQKLDYASQLRSAGLLGAAFDALTLAVQDLLTQQVEAAGKAATSAYLRVTSWPVDPVKGQVYQGEVNTHTYLGNGVWLSTLLHVIPEDE